MSASTDRIITRDEVLGHSSAKDLWLIIHDKVYDCTSFRIDHPGGERALIDYAGRDATEAFDSIGHSNNAVKMLKDMLVGELPEAERTSGKASKAAKAGEVGGDIIASLPIRTLAEVAKMDGSDAVDGEMWIVIRNIVYDVTKFWKMHPGGPKAIKDLAGKDATVEFDKVGHTTNAMSLLTKYYKAKLPASEEKDWSKETAQQMPLYTLEEVAKHCKEGDYWMVIDNRVYDVTNFIASHPGGREPLTHNAGLDATDQFAEVGHSANAKNKLKGLQVGVLVEADRRTAKPATCLSTSYTDVTAESLRKAEIHRDGGKFPFMTTVLIILCFIFSVGGVALMIMADQSRSASVGASADL